MAKNWFAFLAVIGICSLGFVAPASAAHLELLDVQRIEETSPPTSVAGPACSTTIEQNIEQFTAPDGQSASTTVTQSIDMIGNAAECNQNANATQSSILLFLLAPDAGESIGDDVLFCVRATFEQSATSEGNYTATSTVGGSSGVGPATIVRNPSGSPMTVFSFGPSTVVANQPRASDRAATQFIAQIGDEIRVEVGDAATASGMGVGAASTDAASRIELDVGGCLKPVPAMAPAPMAALAFLLVAFGALSLRLRR